MKKFLGFWAAVDVPHSYLQGPQNNCRLVLEAQHSALLIHPTAPRMISLDTCPDQESPRRPALCVPPADTGAGPQNGSYSDHSGTYKPGLEYYALEVLMGCPGAMKTDSRSPESFWQQHSRKG